MCASLLPLQLDIYTWYGQLKTDGRIVHMWKAVQLRWPTVGETPTPIVYVEKTYLFDGAKTAGLVVTALRTTWKRSIVWSAISIQSTQFFGVNHVPVLGYPLESFQLLNAPD